jgi:hypothetical protein
MNRSDTGDPARFWVGDDGVMEGHHMAVTSQHRDELMGDRYATVASAKLGYPVRFVGWVRQHPTGATEPQFAVAREHALDAFNHGLCIQIEPSERA